MTRDPSYHGTHEHAVRFALEVHDDTLQTYEFLNAWSEGNLDEWPEFYEWLDKQEHPRQYPTEDVYMAACRALHWRTAELRFHGIEPIMLPTDCPHYPPEGFDFGSAGETDGGLTKEDYEAIYGWGGQG